MDADRATVMAICASTLHDAVDIAGGIQALARRLRVPTKQLTSWIDGDEQTPPAVFSRALNFVRVAQRR
jgi:hypothetical protein